MEGVDDGNMEGSLVGVWVGDVDVGKLSGSAAVLEGYNVGSMVGVFVGNLVGGLVGTLDPTRHLSLYGTQNCTTSL